MENPFVITEKISSKYFCDREKESADLVKLITNGNNVVLLSRRRLGKTALINYCYENTLLKKDYITIYIDILSTTNLQEFIYIFGKEVFDSIRTKGSRMLKSFMNIVRSLSGKIAIDPFNGLPTLNLQLGDIKEPAFTLKEVFQYLANADKPCIVAIDEFQQVTRYSEKNVEALIRSHLLQINNCRMIFSGSERHLLSDMFIDGKRPFYHSAAIIELSVIPKEKYIPFIIRMFQEKGKRIPELMAKKIYDMFDGITFYVQRVCNGVFSNTAPGSEASDKILELTLEEVLVSYDVIYRMRLSQFTLRQKELLFAIAKEGNVKQITSTEFIQKYSLSSASAVQTSLKSLTKNEVVVNEENGYRIEDLFFRMWINRYF